MFFLFDQNNSGGSFVVDDKVCHRLFIEADSMGEAILIAEDLGCYWDGVDKGIDCPCCGDRWDRPDTIEADRLSYYSVTAGSIDEWKRKYGRCTIVEPPRYDQRSFFQIARGVISFKTIEEYAQFLADKYGWTMPDARIFYKNGTITEIFSKRDKK